MFEKIKNTLQNAVRQVPQFDPASFNDTLAQETEWTPLKRGGANFRTHKLVQVDYTRLEFKSTIGAKIFSLVFVLLGGGVPFAFGMRFLQGTRDIFQPEFYVPLLFGLIFVAVGGFMFYGFAKPVIFDRTKGMYWKGWKAPTGYLAQDSVDEGSRISNIYALQILPEFIRSNKSSYYSYELNLVLKDGSRLNVVDHGNAAKIQEDAKILAEFLGVPVWDATII